MKVSVVTPSFNQAAFLERTLRSVATQEGVEIEHRVFDGGSSDGSVEILRRFEPAVRWVSRPDGGQADAVNQGLAAATGEVIGWLNSDDIYHPGAVARAAAFLEAHPDVDVVYGRADHIGEDDRVLEPYPTEPWDRERLASRCFICQPAAFFRRRVVENFGALDASLRYCMDYEYWLRLGQRGARFAYLPEKLAGSRLHAQTKTLGSRLAVHEEINDMLRRRLGRVPMAWLLAYGYAAADAQGVARGWARRSRAWREALRARSRWSGPAPARTD